MIHAIAGRTEDLISDSNILIKVIEPIVARVRTDTHWIAERGKPPRCIKEPLTRAKLIKHLTNGPRCGVAPIKPGTSVTRVSVIDFDSHQGETEWEDMKVITMDVVQALRDRGFSPIVFRSSGGKGVHLYLIWDKPQDAFSVRKFLQDTLLTVGLSVGTKGVAQAQVEIFPKQDVVEEGKFGNMFVLPLAGHSCPLDPDSLSDIDKANALQIRWKISPNVPAANKPEPKTARTQPVKGELESGAGLGRLRSALDAIPYGNADQFGYQRWLNFVLAIHHASAGSAEGLRLAHDFFSRATEYDGEEIDELWKRADSTRRERPVTEDTIYWEARKHGWSDPKDLDDFEDLTQTEVSSSVKLPSFVRNERGILSTMDNLVKGIGCREVCGMDVAHDTFRDEIMYSTDGGESWVPFKDADYTQQRINLERKGFKPPTKDNIREAVLYVAMKNEFDSAQVWLNRQEWDGVNRVEKFLSDYLGVADTPYHQAVSRYLWTALAGRVLHPGCKADMVVVLTGKQGTRKSSAVAALSPDPQYFAEMSFSEKDNDLSRKIRGRLVIEIAELKGLNSRDAEHVKAWITRQQEDWTPKYREFNTIYPRRAILVGTTNCEDFLSDETGNRRWLPVKVEGIINVDRIIQDCPQLWAEACEMFNKAGRIDYLEAETLAAEIHVEHMMSDPWDSFVAEWLKNRLAIHTNGFDDPPRDYLQTHEVLISALGFHPASIKQCDETRIGKVLIRLGYKKTRKRINGHQPRVYVPTVPTMSSQGRNAESQLN